MAKRIPKRMCIACREMKEKPELFRLVKNQLGNVEMDEKGKAGGRGVYVCKSEKCIEKCIKQKSLNRAFKCNVEGSVSEKLRQKL